MIELFLYRWKFGLDETLSSLYLPEGWESFVIEDQYQDVKVMGETCIPEGRYELTLEVSPKFTPKYGHKMITVNNVPDFTGIRWHRGRTDNDTAGCIIVGDGLLVNANKDSELLESARAYERVYKKVAGYINAGPTFLNVKKLVPFLGGKYALLTVA